MAIEFTLNGEPQSHDVDPQMPLLWVIRDIAGLTGTKYGCGKALCGSCTVHVDGNPVRSCAFPVSAAAGMSVTTIEGLSADGNHPVQKAWRKLNVPQCGYCQAGQIMTAAAFLEKNPNPSEEEIKNAMHGNICRCASYNRVYRAVEVAASKMN